MTTGQRIRDARKKAGMTQAELAEKLGVPYQSVSQWERGLRKPKIETLKKFAVLLGVDIAYFMDLSDISPSLDSAVPLIEEFRSILKETNAKGSIKLSDKEKQDILELASLTGNIPEEISNSSFLENILRENYIALFDKLNMRGKATAVEMISNLAANPEYCFKDGSSTSSKQNAG